MRSPDTPYSIYLRGILNLNPKSIRVLKSLFESRGLDLGIFLYGDIEGFPRGYVGVEERLEATMLLGFRVQAFGLGVQRVRFTAEGPGISIRLSVYGSYLMTLRADSSFRKWHFARSALAGFGIPSQLPCAKASMKHKHMCETFFYMGS